MVLFTMDHTGALSQIITFRYLRHKNEKAILLAADRCRNSEILTNMRGKVFSSIAFFSIRFQPGHLREKTWEEQICKDYQPIFDNLGMDIHDFTEIYCCFDIINNFYIYCHQKGVHVNFIEFFKGQYDNASRYMAFTAFLHGDKLYEDMIRKYNAISGENSTYVKRRYVFQKKFDKDVQLNTYEELYKLDYASRCIIGEAIEADKIQMGREISLFAFNSTGAIESNVKESAYVFNAIIADTYLRHVRDLYLKDHPFSSPVKYSEAAMIFAKAKSLPINIPLELIVLVKQCRLKKMISVMSTSNAKVADYVDENIVLGNDAFRYFHLLIKLMVAYEVKKYLGNDYGDYFHGLSRNFLMNYRKTIEEPFAEGWPKDIDSFKLKGKTYTLLGDISEADEARIEHALSNADADTVVVFFNKNNHYRFVPFDETLLENFLIIRIEKNPREDNIYPHLEDEFLYVFVKDESIREKLQQYEFNQNMRYSGFDIHAEITSDITDLELQNERKRRVRAERSLEKVKEDVKEKDKLEGENKNLRDKLEKLSSQLEAERNDAKRVLLENISRRQSRLEWEQRFYHSLHFLQGEPVYPGNVTESYTYLCALLEALAGNPVKNILEFGCSASTCLAGRHASARKGQHFVLEYDRAWAEFVVLQNRQVFSTTAIIGGGLSVQDFGGDEFYSYAAAKRLPPAVKYGLILVKHPKGMHDKPAADILSLLPHCLEKEFIILLPFGDMVFDQKLPEKIERCLQVSGIGFEKNIYGGNVCIICSPGHKHRFYNDMVESDNVKALAGQG